MYIQETLVKVHNDILTNINKQHVTLLILLDLSATFDTVDHSILLTRLRWKLGLNGTALSWFCYYLSEKTQGMSCSESPFTCISSSLQHSPGILSRSPSVSHIFKQNLWHCRSSPSKSSLLCRWLLALFIVQPKLCFQSQVFIDLIALSRKLSSGWPQTNLCLMTTNPNLL